MPEEQVRKMAMPPQLAAKFGPKKSAPKKELSPALAAAAKRRLSKKAPKASDGDGDEVAGAPMSYLPGVVK